MFELYSRSMEKLAILENAMDRREELPLNGVARLSFSLPLDDPKAALAAPFCFLHDGKGQFYRLLADGESIGAAGVRTYRAEHGIATLVDDLMFGTVLLGGAGMTTREVIESILERQTVRRWRLGDCAFDKRFEYGFESENLLNALFSIPSLFVEGYRWTYRMETLPWTIHLERLRTADRPDFYIRAGKNLISERSERTAAELCTRLYLLGYGEGDNQLTVKEVNGGIPYLQSPEAIVEKYGILSKVYVDRQFEDAQSLMERGRALLDALQEPRFSRTIQTADLYPLTGDLSDRAEPGAVARLTMDGAAAYITLVRRNLDVAGDMSIELSTAPKDVAQDIADLAARQRIEQVYSQGATQIYAQSVQANADADTPAVLNFFIPREMRIINKVAAKISLDRFRSYSRTTAGGGGGASTSAGGGGWASTSSAGGGGTITSGASSRTATSQTTLESSYPSPHFTAYNGTQTDYAGSGNTGAAMGSTGSASESFTGSTAAAGTAHNHGMLHTHGLNSHTHGTPGHAHGMSHLHQFDHTHSLVHTHDIDHTHSLSLGSHTHSVSLPSHAHTVSLPDHSHGIQQGIFRFGNPKGAEIFIGGQPKFTMGMEKEVDLTEYLLNAKGKIPRGSWIRLGVLPDDLAYVTIDIYVQGFVQSRGGGTH